MFPARTGDQMGLYGDLRGATKRRASTGRGPYGYDGRFDGLNLAGSLNIAPKDEERLRARKFCDGCACVDCGNTEENLAEVHKRRHKVNVKNPHAFQDKKNPIVAKGCNCLKSRCLKGYCECFAAGRGCMPICCCKDCENMYGVRPGLDDAFAHHHRRGMLPFDGLGESEEDMSDPRRKMDGRHIPPGRFDHPAAARPSRPAGSEDSSEPPHQDLLNLVAAAEQVERDEDSGESPRKHHGSVATPAPVKLVRSPEGLHLTVVSAPSSGDRSSEDAQRHSFGPPSTRHALQSQVAAALASAPVPQPSLEHVGRDSSSPGTVRVGSTQGAGGGRGPADDEEELPAALSYRSAEENRQPVILQQEHLQAMQQSAAAAVHSRPGGPPAPLERMDVDSSTTHTASPSDTAGVACLNAGAETIGLAPHMHEMQDPAFERANPTAATQNKPHGLESGLASDVGRMGKVQALLVTMVPDDGAADSGHVYCSIPVRVSADGSASSRSHTTLLVPCQDVPAGAPVGQQMRIQLQSVDLSTSDLQDICKSQAAATAKQAKKAKQDTKAAAARKGCALQEEYATTSKQARGADNASQQSADRTTHGAAGAPQPASPRPRDASTQHPLPVTEALAVPQPLAAQVACEEHVPQVAMAARSDAQQVAVKKQAAEKGKEKQGEGRKLPAASGGKGAAAPAAKARDTESKGTKERVKEKDKEMESAARGSSQAKSDGSGGREDEKQKEKEDKEAEERKFRSARLQKRAEREGPQLTQVNFDETFAAASKKRRTSGMQPAVTKEASSQQSPAKSDILSGIIGKSVFVPRRARSAMCAPGLRSSMQAMTANQTVAVVPAAGLPAPAVAALNQATASYVGPMAPGIPAAQMLQGSVAMAPPVVAGGTVVGTAVSASVGAAPAGTAAVRVSGVKDEQEEYAVMGLLSLCTAN